MPRKQSSLHEHGLFVPSHGIQQCVDGQRAMLLAEGSGVADLNVKPLLPLSAVPFTTDSPECMT